MWVGLTDFPKYEINEYGDIRNKYTLEKKYTCNNKHGYLLVQFKIKGKVLTRKVHRLVAEAFLEPPSKELLDACKNSHWGVPVVKHLDNNKTNNYYKNLCWDTQENNNKDANSEGLVPPLKGELNGRSVLTEDLVHKVCKCFEEGMMPSEAVSVFGISRSQATKIRSGHAWKHISEMYNIKVNKRNTTTSND
jgi:hypothetical protein